MLLFKKPFHEGLLSGAITLTFRRWEKPHVKKGGRYRCHPIGVLEVDDVGRVRVASITNAEAKRAGFASKDALVAHLGELGPLDADGEVWRVALHHGGDGDRVELALETELSDDDVAGTPRGSRASTRTPAHRGPRRPSRSSAGSRASPPHGSPRSSDARRSPSRKTCGS